MELPYAEFRFRDIKPQNFVMGLPDDPNRARLLHVIDFGLSRYALAVLFP